MKRIANILLSAIIIVSLSACGSSNESVTKTNDNSKTASQSNYNNDNTKKHNNSKPVEKPQYPTQVKEIQNSFLTAIEVASLPFRISVIEKDSMDESNFYEFYLMHNDADANQLASSLPRVRIQEYQGRISGNFNVSFPDNNPNPIIKDSILLTMYALEPTITSQQCNENLNTLVNTFDGTFDSDVITLSEYKLYLSPSYYDTTMLNVVKISNINNPIDTTGYSSYSSEEMLSPLNTGSKAVLEGEITDIMDDAINVKCGNELYYVHKSKDKFLDALQLNTTYSFYGVICERPILLDGYAGCMRLEYLEKK